MLIDMKDVTVSLEDGYYAKGKVDNVAGYTAGATQIVVEDFTGQVPVGTRLILDGVRGYTVTSTIETTGKTTTISFTPALKANIADEDVVEAGPRFLDIRVGEGNTTFNENKPREYFLDRGRLYGVRDGDETPMEVTMQFMWEELTSGDPLTQPPTPRDVFHQLAPADDWENTDPGNCNSQAVNIILYNEPANCQGQKKELVRFPKFRFEQLSFDAKAASVSVTGKCNVTKAEVERYT